MEYLRGARVLLRDPQRVDKLVVGSVMMLTTMFVPLIGQAVVVGWQARIVREAARGVVSPLPALDWDGQRLLKLGIEGLQVMVVQMVWTLPAAALGILGGFVAPFLLIELAVQTERPGTVMIAGLIGIYLVLGVLAMLLMIPAQVAALRTELTGQIGQGFRVGEVLRFTGRMFRDLVAGTLVTNLFGLALLLAGSLCCIGGFPATVVIMAVQGHFIAQVYSRWVERGGEALPLAE